MKKRRPEDFYENIKTDLPAPLNRVGVAFCFLESSFEFGPVGGWASGWLRERVAL
jgi:hypothetical protein